MSKGSPTNVRLDDPTKTALSSLHIRTDLNTTEIIKRSVQYAHKVWRETGSVEHLLDKHIYQAPLEEIAGRMHLNETRGTEPKPGDWQVTKVLGRVKKKAAS
jgi:hypothetical protein